MQREYGSWIASSVEPDYSVSLSFDSDKVPTDPGEFWTIDVEVPPTLTTSVDRTADGVDPVPVSPQT
jgi:hypothetical protein